MLKKLKQKILNMPNTYSARNLLEYSIPLKDESVVLRLLDENGNAVIENLVPDGKNSTLLAHSINGNYVKFSARTKLGDFIFEFGFLDGIIYASACGKGLWLDVTSNVPLFANGMPYEKSLLNGDKIILSTSKNPPIGGLLRVEREYKTALGDTLTEEREAMLNCCSWNFIYDKEDDVALFTVARSWDISHGGWVMFCWDSFFASLIASQFDTSLAKLNFLQTLQFLTEEDFIPNCKDKRGFTTLDRSQPPVASRVALKIYQKDGDVEFLRYIFPKLKKWNDWFFDNRQISNGIFTWGSKKYTPQINDEWEINGVGNVFGCSLESGMDNSPLYDKSEYDSTTNCLKEGDVGLTSLVYADTTALIEIAKICGFDTCELKEKADEILSSFDFFFKPNEGFFNRNIHDKSFNKSINISYLYSAYLPLDEEKLGFIAKLLTDEKHFFGEFMIPTVSKSESSYNDQNYWRGRIWPPTNYLVYDAVSQRQSLLSEKKLIAEKSRELLLLEWRLFRHVHENYNAITGMGCDLPKDNKIPDINGVFGSDCFYSWGALLPYIYIDFIKNSK